MPLTNQDYKTVLYATGNGVDINNVFYYKSNDASTAVQHQIAFISTILPLIQAVVTEETVFNRLYTINLVDLEDFADSPLSETGTRGTLSMPSFNAWYFKYGRPKRGMNDGRKSFGLLSETDVSDGVAVSTIVDELTALAEGLETPLAALDETFHTPCCAETIFEEPSEEHPKGRYILINILPTTGVSYKRVSSQNSRKR